MLERLAVDSVDCLAVEDSTAGLAAAVGAGIPTVVAPSVHTRGDDFPGALAVLDDLATAALDELQDLHSAQRRPLGGGRSLQVTLRAVTSSPVRARWAISAQFFTNGVIGGSFLPRLPEIKQAYELSDTAYGFVVVALPLGSILAAAVAGPLIRRFGALQVAVIGTVAYAVLLALAGFSPSVLLFVPIMLTAGVMDAVLDSGQNVHGMAVERWYDKSIINSLHASWSLGATMGGFIGAASAGAGIPIGWQMAVGAVVWSALAVIAGINGAVPEKFVRSATSEAEIPDQPVANSGRRFPWARFVPLAVLAICGTLVEDVANNWVTLYLFREIGAAIGVAGAGFAIMLGAQFVGRMLGDPMTDRWGRGAVARTGGAMISVGGLIAVIAPNTWVAVAGFAIAGFGTATLVPAAYAASDGLPGVPHGTGIAMLGWFMRIGFLVTSPAIGLMADAVGLHLALLILPAAGIVATVLAHGTVRNSNNSR
ncbi:MAG TPA: MFS transporter [Actinomycetaceae bacterium]|nr:MFS transporter [Actinomycetaceae bacterium]